MKMQYKDQIPSHVLRRADIQQMVDDGTIDQQHFLIKMIADCLRLKKKEEEK